MDNIHAYYIMLWCIRYLYRYLSVELYPSTAKIALEEGKPRKVLTNIESVETRSLITDIDINTEIEILRSGESCRKTCGFP